MTSYKLRTVWFSTASLVAIAISVPCWGIGGVAWGWAMSIVTNGALIKWMVAGVFWGATCWLFTAPVLLVVLRGLVVRFPPLDPAAVGERLAGVAQRLKYTVDRPSPFDFVCKPARGLARQLEFNTVRVQLHQEGVDVSGPAVVVNRVRKALADAPAPVTTPPPRPS
jgi:hypothetical protein